jgi:NAD(P)-dependent dehydrogenase (short-subunit alcohol dehydrogenase family)
VVVGRDETCGAAAAGELATASDHGDVQFLGADLASQQEIRRLAGAVVDRCGTLDILVNNAAVVAATRRQTMDGMEATLAVGHLAPFLLTELLLPVLCSSAPSRIVNVTSGAVRRTELKLDDLQSERDYHPLRAYERAKLMSLIWTFELARRLEGTDVEVSAADPVVADAGTHRHYPWPTPVRTAMVIARPLLHRLLSAQRAAAGSIYAASSPDLNEQTGLLLDRRCRPVDPPAAARSQRPAGRSGHPRVAAPRLKGRSHDHVPSG